MGASIHVALYVQYCSVSQSKVAQVPVFVMCFILESVRYFGLRYTLEN